MLKTLEDSNKTHYENLLRGQRWMYAVRTGNEHNGLSVIVVGRQKPIEVLFDNCCSADMAIMCAYADELNIERHSPASSQPADQLFYVH